MSIQQRMRISAACLAALIAAFLIVSCKLTGGTPHARYPTRLSPDIRERFNSAELLYQAGNMQAADAAFAEFITVHDYNPLTDEARFKRGEIRFAQGKYADALGYYRSATAGVYNPSIAPHAVLKAALSLYHLKRYDETIDQLSQLVRQDASPIVRVRADSLGMIAGRQLAWSGKRLVRFALFLTDDYIDLGGAIEEIKKVELIVSEPDAHSYVRAWIDDNAVTPDDIDALPRASYEKKPSGGYVLYKEALVSRRMGDFAGATRRLKRFTRSYPKNEYYARAQDLLAETSARSGAAAYKVGVILPLSGQYRVYGESVLHGIECALGIYPPCEGPANVQMVVKDSRGSAATAAEAVAELDAENVMAIVGPLTSAAVMQAAHAAQERKIPMISLSQREGVTAIGDFVFRNSITAQSEVASLVDYALGSKKLKRFYIFYPKNPKGEEYRFLFDGAVRAQGGRLVGARGYNPNSQDIAADFRGMNIHTGHIDLTQEAEQAGYDALFFPGSAWAAAYMAPQFTMMGLDKVQIMGTMRWNDPALIKRSTPHLNGAIFVEAFDKDSADAEVRDFVSRYQRAYGKEPTLLEALGYDSMKMIMASSKQGKSRRQTMRDALAAIRDHRGVTGPISFDANGDAQRTLKVMKISGGSAKAVN